MMNTGRVAKKSGLPVKKIRYYNRKLVNQTNYSTAGYSIRSNIEVATLVLISRARNLNFLFMSAES